MEIPGREIRTKKNYNKKFEYPRDNPRYNFLSLLYEELVL